MVGLLTEQPSHRPSAFDEALKLPLLSAWN